MKTIKIMTFAAVVMLGALAAGGCSDFLDIKPKGRDVPQTVAHYNGMFNSTNLLNFTYIRMNETGSTSLLQTDTYWQLMCDAHIADETSFAAMSARSQNAFMWADDIFQENEHCAEYGAMYYQIYTYNLIANNVMDATEGTEQEKRALLAEARVNRALNYYFLAQFFGKPYNEATAATDLCVPLVTEANSSETNFTRATVKEVYDFMIAELEESCPQLDRATRHRLRMFQPAGYIILAKVYMQMGRYGDATTAFQKAENAMSESEVVLGLFDYNTTLSAWGYNPAMPFAWSGGYPTNFDVNNIEVAFLKQGSMMSYTLQLFAPNVYVKPEFMALYEDDDHRRKFFANKNSTGTIDYPYYRRLFVRSMPNYAADMPEYYLLFAECLARTGNLTKARELVTTLRKHRMPVESAEIPSGVTTADQLIRFIVEERHREFMVMGHRWFDMRRLWNDPLFQDLKDGYTHTTGERTFVLTEDRLVYRIPPRVMSFNPRWINNN
ncbi:MAG: RagB/SusD family nutrient uptake outer membrane protein [Rikenellaceae bacterium]|nr:RagB/SusD family nutrient uptake outer membrane protein [Rikenellaceae bacterium]MCL2692975.1 RagB/SusD family nutrient uptake outer membrane protein [Rikenellaceae bacterium]